MSTPLSISALNQIKTLVYAMSVSGGYNLDWSDGNYEDRALENSTDTAYAVISLVEENNNDQASSATSNTFFNELSININVRTPLSVEPSNPIPESRLQLYKALDDLKRLIGNNYDIGDYGPILYTGCEINTEGVKSGDRFTPLSLDVKFTLYIYQLRNNVFQTLQGVL